MAIDPEYLVRSLIEIKEKLAYLETTVNDSFDSFSGELAENNEHLKEHMHRTELLENEIKDFREFMIRTKFLSNLVGIIGGAIVAVGGFILAFLKLYR